MTRSVRGLACGSDPCAWAGAGATSAATTAVTETSAKRANRDIDTSHSGCRLGRKRWGTRLWSRLGPRLHDARVKTFANGTDSLRPSLRPGCWAPRERAARLLHPTSQRAGTSARELVRAAASPGPANTHRHMAITMTMPSGGVRTGAGGSERRDE